VVLARVGDVAGFLTLVAAAAGIWGANGALTSFRVRIIRLAATRILPSFRRPSAASTQSPSCAAYMLNVHNMETHEQLGVLAHGVGPAGR
jgi:hypothetical protein